MQQLSLPALPQIFIHYQSTLIAYITAALFSVSVFAERSFYGDSVCVSFTCVCVCVCVCACVRVCVCACVCILFTVEAYKAGGGDCMGTMQTLLHIESKPVQGTGLPKIGSHTEKDR